MASIIFNWEKYAGAVGITATIPAGKHFDFASWPDNVPNAVKVNATNRKLERVKALKEWRAMSFVLQQYTGVSYEDCRLPSDCVIRPQLPGEQRVKVVDGAYDRFFLRGEDGVEKEVLPLIEDPGTWKQVTVSLDSGAVGRAGAAFVKHRLNLFIYVMYDLVHRLIRDTKLAMEGVKPIHRAVLFYTFIASLNCRPFGSGTWHEEKKAKLLNFKSTLPGQSRNAFFRKDAALWVGDLGPEVRADTDEDFASLWDMLDDLASFNIKLENPKAMRWFSINGAMSAQMSEFWPLKMILKYDSAGATLDNDDAEPYCDPTDAASMNPRKELNKLRAMAGGVEACRRIANAEAPCPHPNLLVGKQNRVVFLQRPMRVWQVTTTTASTLQQLVKRSLDVRSRGHDKMHHS